MNSCNPVFMEIGARVGAKDMLKYYQKLGLYERTGVDLPGEANSSKIGAVELATMSFGQSIQITPLQLLRAVSAGINGGKLVTPHLAMEKKDSITKEIIQYEYPIKPGAVSEERNGSCSGSKRKDLYSEILFVFKSFGSSSCGGNREERAG